MIDLHIFTIRILLALGLGFIIGIEREWRNKDSGIRTNSMAAMGSAIFVLISMKVVDGNDDVTRIIGQVVTGVGFLGAGVIFRQGINVHGLNSAAIIWCSSAIGCLSAAGFVLEALVSTGLVLFTNIAILPLEKWLTKKRIKRRGSSGKIVNLKTFSK